LTLGLPPPGKDASELKQLRFVRDLNVRTLAFLPLIVVLFFLLEIPLWGFLVLAATVLIQVFSIWSLTQRIRRTRRT
jgi:hypothetical protein